MLLDYLEGGETPENFLEGFPTVSRDLAISGREEAKRLLLVRPAAKEALRSIGPGATVTIQF
jgi:hypothetical protein